MLKVLIEIRGQKVHVGNIIGDHTNAIFTYTDEYLSYPDSHSISISMPLRKGAFDETITKNFFEGLLPEGFTKRCVANYLQADENDYITILSELGRECLGAITIVSDDKKAPTAQYKRLDMRIIKKLAREGASQSAHIVAGSHLSLTGASGKVGLYLDESKARWHQPIDDAPSTHIVKQSHVRLSHIVANEQLCLLTAKNLGINVVDSFVIKDESLGDDQLLFATKRYDRVIGDNPRYIDAMPAPYRLHQEDFAAAMGIASGNKYEKSGEDYLKKAFDILHIYSANPIEDRLRLWDLCIFNYLIGNTDNHIKNISLLYSADLKQIRLAPAYDIISTLVYDSSTANMAMSIGDEYNINKITRRSFASQAKKVGISENFAMSRFDEMASGFIPALKQAKKEVATQGIVGVDSIATKIMKNARLALKKDHDRY